MRSRALALRGAACVAAALAVAGCSQASSSSSAITVTGHRLDIYMSEPANLKSDPVAQDVIDAEELAFRQHAGEVTDYKVFLAPVSSAKVSDTARQAIQDIAAIAYLGELAPGASDQTAGITNAVDLLQVSPTDTALELSQHTPAVKGSPQSYFESWGSYGRTFARMVPTSAQEASAQVAEMKSLGVASLFIADDSSDYGRALADALTSDATSAGITISKTMSTAAGIFYAGVSPTLAASFFKTAATQDPSAELFGPSSLNSAAFTGAVGSLNHLYVTIPGFMPRQLNAAGQAFERAFKTRYGHTPNVEAIFGYEAMTRLLAVIKGAGKGANNRATVVSDFLKASASDSALGSYKINSAGNTSLDSFVIARLRHGALVPFKAAPTGS